MSSVSSIQFTDLSAADAEPDGKLLQDIFQSKGYSCESFPKITDDWSSVVMNFENGPSVDEAEKIIRGSAGNLLSEDLLIKTSDNEEHILNL